MPLRTSLRPADARLRVDLAETGGRRSTLRDETVPRTPRPRPTGTGSAHPAYLSWKKRRILLMRVFWTSTASVLW